MISAVELVYVRVFKGLMNHYEECFNHGPDLGVLVCWKKGQKPVVFFFKESGLRNGITSVDSEILRFCLVDTNW